MMRVRLISWGLAVIGLSVGIVGRGEAVTIPVDGYAAVVNDKVITVDSVTVAMQPIERQIRESYSGTGMEEKLVDAYEKTLDSLIERELILDEYRQKKLVVSDNIVNGRVDEIILMRFNNNRLEFKRALEAEGVTFEEWRTELKNRMIVSLMRSKEVDDMVTISPQAIRDAYEKNMKRYQTPAQVELRMIVLHSGATEEEKAVKMKQAEDIRNRLLAGESFESLARRVSEGAKAAEGGYYGWVNPQSRRPELAIALEDLEPGEISEAIEAEDDLYILRIEARRNAAIRSFEQARDDIHEELRKQEIERLYQAWIERLKAKAFIRKFN